MVLLLDGPSDIMVQFCLQALQIDTASYQQSQCVSHLISRIIHTISLGSRAALGSE